MFFQLVKVECLDLKVSTFFVSLRKMALYFRRNIILFILLSVFLTVIKGTNTTDIQPLSKDISLIYGEYYIGKLYCKFATEAVIRESKGLVEASCHRKLEKMAQILPDGNVSRPFLNYGAIKGYVPACKKLNIPNGILGECNPGLKIPLVHTVCTYRCAPGFIATSNNVTCSLMGPLNNVSVQWLKDRDVFDPENMESEYCKQLTIPNGKLGVCSMDSDRTQLHCNYSCDPDCIATNSTEILHFDMNNYSSFQSSSVKKLCIRDPTVEPLSQKGGTPTMPVAVSVSAAIVMIIAIVILALPCTRKKLIKKPTRKVNVAIEDAVQEDPPNVNDPLLLVPLPALPDDNRPTVTPTEAFPELPLEEKCSFLRTQEFNKDRIGHEKVGVKDIPGLDPALKHVLQELSEPLNDDMTLQEKFSGYACGAELTAGGEELKTVGTELKTKENHNCSTDVRFLLDTTSHIYRLKLLGELEVIDGRRRDQTLVGYVLKNKEDLHFPTENSIKLQEETFKNKVDEKVSEYFLRHMSYHGHTIGMMLEYFADVDASNVIEVVLEVHKGCPFCEKFRK